MASARDIELATKANTFGANFALRIILECRRSEIPISAGFALVEKESGFRNVFGHDPTDSIPEEWKGGLVTKNRYLKYKEARKAGKGSQGVGPAQITWWEYQDRADALGGAWVAANSIRVGFEVFAAEYKRRKAEGNTTERSLELAARKYNGTGTAAVHYGQDFVLKYDKWHRRLT